MRNKVGDIGLHKFIAGLLKSQLRRHRDEQCVLDHKQQAGVFVSDCGIWRHSMIIAEGTGSAVNISYSDSAKGRFLRSTLTRIKKL
jgi:hypothetical protein